MFSVAYNTIENSRWASGASGSNYRSYTGALPNLATSDSRIRKQDFVPYGYVLCEESIGDDLR